jgi:hypothetical protein
MKYENSCGNMRKITPVQNIARIRKPSSAGVEGQHYWTLKKQNIRVSSIRKRHSGRLL